MFCLFSLQFLHAIQDLEPEKEYNKTHNIRQRIWKIRSKKVVLATGSIERPIQYLIITTDQVLCLQIVLENI